MDIEAHMKAELDGKFFKYFENHGSAAQPHAGPYFRAIVVPLDYIPDHRPSWDFEADPFGPPHVNVIPFTPEQDDLIITLRAQGKEWRKVGRAVRRDAGTTRRRYKELCQERGIQPAPRAGLGVRKYRLLPAETVERILSLRKAKWSLERIAARVGLSRPAVTGVIKEAGQGA